ncbi:MAG: hypothetical protein Q4P25_04100 [Tissierellia bacterium]|nr:hypothetical protein [Tissierellia bacterium]
MTKLERRIRQGIGITLAVALAYVGFTALIEYFFRFILWLDNFEPIRISLAGVVLIVLVYMVENGGKQ